MNWKKWTHKPSHGENAKYEEFGIETYAISFQMVFTTC
jgi:hypothetical protein